MGKLIDLHVDLQTHHPQELMDALYEEVFDGYPDEDEVDVVLAIDTIDDEDGHTTGLIVRDYQAIRAGEEVLYGDHTNTVEMLKTIDAWGREHGNHYIFVHKHPENHPFATERDERMADALGTIDFVRSAEPQPGEGQKRTFVMMIIANRNVSYPIEPPDRPLPIGDIDIDAELVRRMARQLQRATGIPDDHPFMLGAERIIDLAAKTIAARKADNRQAMIALAAEGIQLIGEQQRMSDELRAKLDPHGHREVVDGLLAQLPPHLRDKIDVEELVAMMETMEVGDDIEVDLGGGDMMSLGKIRVPKQPEAGNWDAAPTVSGDEPLKMPPPVEASRPFADLDLSGLPDPMADMRAKLAAARGQATPPTPHPVVFEDVVSDPGSVEHAENEGLPPTPERPEVPDIFRNMGGPIDFGSGPSPV